MALGRAVCRRPGWIVSLWAAAAAALAVFAPSWDAACQDDDIRFMPAECRSVRGYELLRQAFPNEASGSRLAIALERGGRPLAAADLALLKTMAGRIESLRRAEPALGILNVQGPHDPFMGQRLRSTDGCCALLTVGLESPFLARRTQHALDRIEEALAPSFRDARSDADLALTFTGPAGFGRDLNRAVRSSFHDTTLATVILVVAFLLWVYRSPTLALVPLATIAVSVWVSFNLLALLATGFGLPLVNIANVFIVVILFGVGTDYCLFLVSRCKEEACEGGDVRDAVAKALGKVGGAVAASAATVICGLGLMGCAEFMKLRATGPALAISLLVALAAALTLAPALLALIGPWALRRSVPRPAAAEAKRAEWGRFCLAAIAKRPGAVWLGVTLLLLPFALCGADVSYCSAPLNELPKDAPSRRGLESIRAHFPPGELGPVAVLLPCRTSWSAPAGWAALERLTAKLAALPEVAEVRSLTAPLGQTAPRGLAAALAPVAALRHLGRAGEDHVARLDVVLRCDPYSPPSAAALAEVARTVETEAAGQPFGLFGVTALMEDLAEVQRRDASRIYLLIAAAVQCILLLLVRRPLIAVYLMASVLFSYWATLGLTELLGPLLFGGAWGPLDWKTPFFLFAILVAVGEDYNIFLLSRVMEEEKQHGLAEAALRAAASAGKTITSCGLIMAGTFAALLLGELSTLRQLGLALTLGVLLDAFVVRVFLAPCFLVLLDRWTKAWRGDRPTPRPLAQRFRLRRRPENLPAERQVAARAST